MAAIRRFFDPKWSLAIALFLCGARVALALANDACSGAVAVTSLPYSNTENTSGAAAASNDPTPPCGNGAKHRSVWYAFTPAIDMDITADTIGSSYDTILSVYTGFCGSLGAVPGACNDNFLGLQSQVSFMATAGTTYYFMISATTTTGGTLVFGAGGLALPTATFTATSTSTRTPTPTQTRTPTPTRTPNVGPGGNVTVSALAINPTAPATLYAGTDAGVFESTNGGNSWSAMNTGVNGSYVLTLAIDPTTPTTLYAGTDGGVLKSTNGGGSWNTIDTGLDASYVGALAIDPATPTTLYAGTLDGGVFESTNGGDAWSVVNMGLTDPQVFALAIDPTTPATLYAGTYSGGVFQSTNGGGSWSAVTAGLTYLGSSPTVEALAIDPATPATLYAATYGGGVFKSTNGGGSWNAVDTGLTSYNVRALAINATTPTTLYAGTDNGAFESTNGGGTWGAVDTTLSKFTVYGLAIDPTTPTTLYAGTDEGVFVIDLPKAASPTATLTVIPTDTPTTTQTATLTPVPPDNSTPIPTATSTLILPPSPTVTQAVNGVTSGQPTIDGGASILFLPLVAADASTDTLIQISSIANSLVHADCFYVAGDSCAQTAFGLFLEKQQATHWVASRGRPNDASDRTCSPTNFDCDGAGSDPGVPNVPPLPDGFHGLLVCVETDDTHSPVTGNHLVATASVVDTSTGHVAQYSAVGLTGNPSAVPGQPLCLGGQQATAECPNGADYDGCPDTWVVNFLPDGAIDPVVGTPASVNTHFVILPCARDFQNGTIPGTIVQYLWYNQYSQRFSSSKSVGCWSDLQISLIDTPTGAHSAFSADVLGNGPAEARLQAVGGGVIVLPYEIHHSGANGDATVMGNAHAEGLRAQPDLLTLPAPAMERKP